MADNKMVPRSEFGEKMRKHFMFGELNRNLNHGSFGSYPAEVQQKLRSFQDAIEANPDHFIRYVNPQKLDESRAAVAKLMNTSVDTVVLCQNATTGVNTVLRNLAPTFSKGDKILYFDTIYGACGKTIQSIIETWPHLGTVKIEYTYPVSDEFLLSAFQAALQHETEIGCRVRIAIFDTIVSMPGVRMPFEALTAACKDHHVMSLIDAAHGVGHIPINISKLDPDFLVSNLHKWLYVPRGCAVFYVPIRNQKLIRTSLPTSHGFIAHADEDSLAISALQSLGVKGNPQRSAKGPLPTSSKPDFAINFEFVGTIDPAPYLCVPAAIKFREDICGGEQQIMSYITWLAQYGGDRAAQILGTEVMDNPNGTLTRGIAMVNIRVPLRITYPVAKILNGSMEAYNESDVDLGEDLSPDTLVHWMHQQIMDKYKTFIALMWYGDAIWARFSAQIYLQLSDFEWGASVLLDMCERVKNGEHLVCKISDNS